jgi:hypothetical protein
MSKLATDNIKDRGISFADSLIKGKGFFGSWVHNLGACLYKPYVISSAIRISKEKPDDWRSTTAGEDLGECIGFVNAVAVHVCAGIGVVSSDHPELLLTPVATNVISGVYEMTKPLYQKAKENLEYMTMHRAADEKIKEAAGQLERQKEKPAEKPVEETKKPKEYM